MAAAPGGRDRPSAARLAADPGGEPARPSSPTAYADEHLTADAAAASGFVDEVIEPAETRATGSPGRWRALEAR